VKVISALYNTPDRDYAMLMLNLQESVKKVGYDFEQYLLERDPMIRFGGKDDYFAPCTFKPFIIKRALQELKEDVLWLDSDCLIKDRVNEIFDDCDVAVTLRRFDRTHLRDIYDGYINAGVMAFRYNQRSLSLIDRWMDQLAGSRADQDAFNKVLLDYSFLDKFGEIIDIEGTKVKILDCDTYNFFYFEDKDKIDKAKIYHIKGHLRPLYYDMIAEKVLGGEYVINSRH